MAKRLGYCIPCGEAGRYTDATVVIDGDQMCATCARMPGVQPASEPELQGPEPLPPEPSTVKMCGRGCGGVSHRGRCAGRPVGGFDGASLHQGLPAPVPLKAAEVLEPVRLELKEGVMRLAPRGWTAEQDHPEVGDAISPDPMNDDAMSSHGQLLSRKERGVQMDRLVAQKVSIADIPKVDAPRHPQGRIGELWALFQSLGTGESLKVKCRDTTHVGCTDRGLRLKAKRVGMKVESRRIGSDYYCWRGNLFQS